MLHTSEDPIRVKFLYRGRSDNGDQLWSRQFPNSMTRWGQCEFTFDKEEENYDWFVVYDDLPPNDTERFSRRIEKLKCANENTLLITSEPSTIKIYGRKYVNQFGHVLTTQEPWVIHHPQAIFSQCGYRWFYGIGQDHVREFNDISNHPPVSKTKSISTVCSNKRQKNTVHAIRFEFTQFLKKELPELEVYGRGVNPLDDKADALDPYKYHVVIENHRGRHHWSEKLADAFLGHVLPFYYGCENVFDYFPQDSIILIDPHNMEGSCHKIKEAIKNGEYERRIKAIAEARELVLNKYNIFATVSDLIVRRNTQSKVEKGTLNSSPHQILSRRAIRDTNLFTSIEYYIERYAVKWKLSTNLFPKNRDY